MTFELNDIEPNIAIGIYFDDSSHLYEPKRGLTQLRHEEILTLIFFEFIFLTAKL
jgi:hypothetical protein